MTLKFRIGVASEPYEPTIMKYIVGNKQILNEKDDSWLQENQGNKPV